MKQAYMQYIEIEDAACSSFFNLSGQNFVRSRLQRNFWSRLLCLIIKTEMIGTTRIFYIGMSLFQYFVSSVAKVLYYYYFRFFFLSYITDNFPLK